VEEPWLGQSAQVPQSFTVKNDKLQWPVEEPWILNPSSSSYGSPSQGDLALSAPDERHKAVSTDLIHKEECSVIPVEDFICTVILINSSICTMQRIAVLENDKLVELLLEPVKNNVQCDSVYLGLVTKLVPQMGGAFVNIGSSRLSFMDLNPNREPFIFLPFHGHLKHRVDRSTFDSSSLDVDIPKAVAFSDVVEELDDADIDQSEDEIDESLKSAQNFDLFRVIDENVNGSTVVGSGHENDQKRSLRLPFGDLGLLQTGARSTGIKDRIWSEVRSGTRMIVQVVKEGLGMKGPTLTPYPKLRSRFWVLSTRCSTIGISKKISGVERTRLREIAKTLQPPGFGLTLRTVAAGHSLVDLKKDLEGLLSTWRSVVEHAKSAALAADEGVDGAVPVMLHRAMGQTLSIVQDYFNDRVQKMVVDSPRTYHEVTKYLQDIAPDLCGRVELYDSRTPLFDEYNIEGEIEGILHKRVPLSNGGYLVIEQTEALVSIDVNGGQCMLGQGTSQEDAILEVNLVAAKQIARELRLRDIGGIIVVDFIDMVLD
ncbi:hypothetical protein M569_03127, partial [Genlisea aurea]